MKSGYKILTLLAVLLVSFVSLSAIAQQKTDHETVKTKVSKAAKKVEAKATETKDEAKAKMHHKGHHGHHMMHEQQQVQETAPVMGYVKPVTLMHAND